MLRDIQTYIANHGTVSMLDLSLHFHTDSQTLEPMLNKLSRKGRIHKLPVPQKCVGCTCCHQTSLELYQWVERVTVDKQQTSGRQAVDTHEPQRQVPCKHCVD